MPEANIGPVVNPSLQSKAQAAPIRYFMVDDYPLFVEVLKEVLAIDGGFQVLGQSHRGREALVAIRRERPDLVLVDLDLPDVGGLELIHQIRAENLADKIVVCSALMHDETIEVALALGADAFVGKNTRVNLLLACLKGIMQGEHSADEHVERVRRAMHQYGQVHKAPTRRDYVILLGLVAERPAAAIARELGVSLSTIYKARRRLASRFAVQARGARQRLAERLGIRARLETPVP